MYKKINKCRICGNTNLVNVIDLGEQVLTGVFPKNIFEEITKGPLSLVKCVSKNENTCCGLLQLEYSYSLPEMYGENYGYRSGLNQSMVEHLSDIVKYAINGMELLPKDYIIDIGSNDSTLLQFYGEFNQLNLIGVDPTGIKFKKYYPDWIKLISDFFPNEELKKIMNGNKAKIITSMCMFYDLEDPVSFAKEVADLLIDDGIWVLEQSYYPLMLDKNAFDTICHEHLEFYGIKQIDWIMNKAGLCVIDVQLNDSNGGSFLIKVVKKGSKYIENINVRNLYDKELENYTDVSIFENFKERIEINKNKLLSFIKEERGKGKRILGYGASTKGNVLLQYYGISKDDIESIVEINPDKFGCYTPQTNIPIISDRDIMNNIPDYLLILPWHFRNMILSKEKELLKSGCKFIFPLPEFEVVSLEDLKFNED